LTDNPLHLALYTNVYKPVVNGVAISVEGFRESLLKKGHRVYVFAPDSPEELPVERFVIRYPAFDLPIQKYPIVVPVSPFADQFVKISMPDVLHAHHPALLGRAAVQHSERHKLPLVFTYHTRYHDYAHYAQPFPKDKVRELITHWLGHFMAYCHHLVVPSDSIRQLVAETYGLEKQVSVVATGIDLERFRPTDKMESRAKLGWAPEETWLPEPRWWPSTLPALEML
jgi:1,2-diacylglycerol 3-alpha-glucosyltransferase